MAEARTTAVTKSLGHVVVIGGCGFLGKNIIALLQQRGACTKISALDLRPAAEPSAGVDYHFGDITDEARMHELFQKIKPNVVIHTASPIFNANQPELMRKVNVDGTKTMVKVSQDAGVNAFVYTSSASVLSDNENDLINADEDYPMVLGKNQKEYYTVTKGLAEQHVIASNRPGGSSKFLTCAIRPAGIIGVGDVQLLPPMLGAYYRGQTKFQIGENTNLFDFTEVTNVAHAHHLAAAALLVTIDREAQGQAAPLDSEKVDGEAFLITNDSPAYFWDFTRSAWAAAGDTTRSKDVWVLPKDFGLFIATLMEWIFWALRWGKPKLTRQQVRYSCMTRYYDISKAKRRLGYRPIVPLYDGVKRGVADVIRRGIAPGMPEHLKGPSAEPKKDI